jgi:hypothetical protein
MNSDEENIPDYHSFVDSRLSASGFRIVTITEDLMKNRLNDFMTFVNSVRLEYSGLYGWKQETKEYFLNGLVDKWKYSYAILNNDGDICLVNFSSVYEELLHTHCTYVGNAYRSHGFAKLHNLKLCQSGLDNGFAGIEGYWPRTNNESIILYLRMGWKIESVIESKDCVLMKTSIEESRDRTIALINKNIRNK